MKEIDEANLPVGTTGHFANMHRWLQRGLFVCLVVLVFEASFSLPGLLGLPQPEPEKGRGRRAKK